MIVTDRLHGHILAILLDIPTVIIDNKIHKLYNFWQTWTRGMAKVRIAQDAEEASQLALELLQLYGSDVRIFPNGGVKIHVDLLKDYEKSILNM